MKFRIGTTIALFALCVSVFPGCLTAKIPETSRWNICYTGAARQTPAQPKYGVARVLQVSVRAPYGAKGLSVLRKNGTMAFDPCNEFAGGTTPLLKGLAIDAFAASGLFKAVVSSSSSASAAVSAEVVFTRVALDCREGGRKAVVSASAILVDGGEIIASAKGDGEADAASGDYGEAFSKAASAALDAAVGRL